MSTEITDPEITDPEITDPEVRAFIARAAAYYPEGKASLAIPERRRRYDAMAADLRQPRPPGVAVTDETVAGPAGPVAHPVAQRRYRPEAAGPVTVVYFHGGGFMLGGLDSHDDVCAEIAAATRCPVVAVDYRRTPEHVHPAAYEDSLAAARAALRAGPVILAGDSAGGNLAAALALALRGEDVRGQVLIYPALGGERIGLAAYAENAEAPVLTTADMHFYHRLRAGGEPPDDDPTFFPLAATDLAGAAPCFASAAAVDPLRDDAVEYVRRLAAAGVEASCTVEPELPHGHLRARVGSARARAAFERILAAVAGFAGSPALSAR